jgi:predicted outer membrane protein
VSGWVTDRFGRRLVFYGALIVYLAGVLSSAFAWDFLSFAFFHMLTGMGIGGEYAAVNSAIDELIPAKYRGRIDLIVNGSFWVGAAAGAAVTPLLLDCSLFAVNVDWRLGIGGVLGLAILLLRRFVPESPRWLVTHCRAEEAEQTVREIERDVEASTGRRLAPAGGSLTIHPRKSFGLGIIFASMLGKNRSRSFLALVLMVAQSFLMALVLLATPAFAQSIGEKTGVNSTLGITPTTANFVKEAATSHMFEIQSSQLAQERGNATEKAFAATMVKDHTKTSDDLKSMISSGDVKAELPSGLDSSHQSELDKLKSLKGAEFSSRYDSDQQSGHKDAVSLFERYAKGGDNLKLKDWADKTLPTLRHHLDMANDLTTGKTVGSH